MSVMLAHQGGSDNRTTQAQGHYETAHRRRRHHHHVVERDGPWRKPEEMFPAYDPDIGRRHLAALDPEVFDPVSGHMVITYQTYVVRTPRHTILIDTCTGEDKGYPPPMDFPKQPWLDGLHPSACAFRTSITSSARTCTSTTPAGTRCCATAAGCRPSRRRNTSSTSASMPRGRTRPNAAAIGPAAAAMCGRSIASRWSRPGKRFWSTTIISSTIRSGSRRRPAIRRAIAASISARAGSRRSPGAARSPSSMCEAMRPCIKS